MYYINVVRKWQTNNSTISEFRTSDGAISGYFLERPGPDSVVKDLRLRVPEGTYNLQWHTSGNENIMPYNPVPLLSNNKVAAGRKILIHNGNLPAHTDGCLLPGMTKETDKVVTSIPILNKIKQYINQKGIQNVKIVITSNYQTGQQ